MWGKRLAQLHSQRRRNQPTMQRRPLSLSITKVALFVQGTSVLAERMMVEVFVYMVATVTLNISEREYIAAIIRASEPDGKYYLSTQRGRQKQQFEAQDDDAAILEGMALVGRMALQEAKERRLSQHTTLEQLYNELLEDDV